MYDFKTHAEIGGPASEGSGSWGVVIDGREFVGIGQTEGTAFLEVLPGGSFAYLGRLPVTPGAEPVIWKEIKANGDYLIIGSEAESHGIQIFDMKKLLDIDPASPKVFDSATEVTSLFNGITAAALLEYSDLHDYRSTNRSITQRRGE